MNKYKIAPLSRIAGCSGRESLGQFVPVPAIRHGSPAAGTPLRAT